MIDFLWLVFGIVVILGIVLGVVALFLIIVVMLFGDDNRYN